MKSISLRNVPNDVYVALQEMARINHRSLQEQVRHILEQDVRLRRGSSVQTAAKWRSRLSGRRLSDSVQSIREDRQR